MTLSRYRPSAMSKVSRMVGDYVRSRVVNQTLEKGKASDRVAVIEERQLPVGQHPASRNYIHLKGLKRFSVFLKACTSS
jgi:hypothetical protein